MVEVPSTRRLTAVRRAPAAGSSVEHDDADRCRAAACCASPLHDRHVALGAKIAEFAGWDMPLEYAGGGVLREHAAVREQVGVFDVSHLGKALVTRPGRGRVRQRDA